MALQFQFEFNELKSNLESTISRNPILNREHEFFLFSNINSIKTRLLINSLAYDEAYNRFVDIVNSRVNSNDAHEIFMIASFETPEEYDANAKVSMDFIRSINTLNKQEVQSRLQNFNISYDIFREVYDIYLEHNEANILTKTLEYDLQYHINKIYLSNLKIILRMLTSYKNVTSLTIQDLFSEGIIGLGRSIELFNCNLGIKFSTYASQWIKASINRAIADKASIIRIPVNIKEMNKEVDRIRAKFELEFGREPFEFEIISQMKRKVASLSNLNVAFAYYPIDTNNSPECNDAADTLVSFEENMIDHKILDETDTHTIKKLRNIIKEYVDSIEDELEQYYLRYYFGLNDSQQVKSKDEMLSELNIHSTEYDRIRKKALANLKRILGQNRVLIEAYSLEAGWDTHSNLEF